MIINNKKLPWLIVQRGFKIPSFNFATEVEKIPGRDGAVLKNRELNHYEFDLPLYALNDSIYGEKNHDEILNELVRLFDYDKPVKLKLSSKNWYWYAMFDGPFEIDMTKDGFIEFSVKVILLDPYKYSDTEYTSPAYKDQIAVKNDGTAKTYPIIEATAIKDSTMFMITRADEDYFQVGEPESANNETKDLNPILVKSTGNTLSGWQYETQGKIISKNEGSALANGTVETNGYTIGAATFGTRNNKGWYGPALKRSLFHPVNDFTVTADMKLFDQTKGTSSVGKVMVHLYDEMNNVVCTFGLYDATGSKNNIKAWFGIYNEFGERFEIYDNAGNYAYDDEYIYLSVSRRDNVWRFKTWHYYKDAKGKRKITSRMNKVYNDRGGIYSKTIAQVGFQISRHTNFEVQKARINEIKLQEHLGGNEIPYIVKAGEVVYIDMDQEFVTIDNEPALQHKAFGSDYFYVDKGITELFVLPQGYFDTTVTWVNRFL
ncbi:phage tail family protein [Macrococcoides bohemicum]|uniref:Phage tail family protein n=1 Tax=Macrococcoides bohemicum TaxID=1903056 RepID=A0AAJ4TWC1_9STAP|nr:phage tail domain-containing protein [Macrococcus bohemicus]QYA42059.1 phage tail family protein [Macrococcus bohemicus]